MNRSQRWLAVTALATAWAITEDGLLLLLMLVATARAPFETVADAPLLEMRLDTTRQLVYT